MIWSEQPYNTCLCVFTTSSSWFHAGGNNIQSMFFCVLEEMKYFEYDNGTLNKKQGIYNIFSCMNEFC